MEGKKHRKNCACLFCKQSRLRAEEAGPLTVGDVSFAKVLQVKGEVVDADAPIITYPVGHSAKDRVIQWLFLRGQTPDITLTDAAKEIGIAPRTLAAHVRAATKEGWLQFSNPLEKLEHKVIPQAVDNLLEFLEAKDKQVTIEVAKGTIFKSFQESQGINKAPQTVLALRIETIPQEGVNIGVVEGKIIGKPKQILESIPIEVKSE